MAGPGETRTTSLLQSCGQLWARRDAGALVCGAWAVLAVTLQFSSGVKQRYNIFRQTLISSLNSWLIIGRYQQMHCQF